MLFKHQILCLFPHSICVVLDFAFHDEWAKRTKKKATVAPSKTRETTTKHTTVLRWVLSKFCIWQAFLKWCKIHSAISIPEQCANKNSKLKNHFFCMLLPLSISPSLLRSHTLLPCLCLYLFHISRCLYVSQWIFHRTITTECHCLWMYMRVWSKYVHFVSHFLSFWFSVQMTHWNMHGFDITAIYVLILDQKRRNKYTAYTYTKICSTSSTEKHTCIRKWNLCTVQYIYIEIAFRCNHTHMVAYTLL